MRKGGIPPFWPLPREKLIPAKLKLYGVSSWNQTEPPEKQSANPRVWYILKITYFAAQGQAYMPTWSYYNSNSIDTTYRRKQAMQSNMLMHLGKP